MLKSLLTLLTRFLFINDCDEKALVLLIFLFELRLTNSFIPLSKILSIFLKIVLSFTHIVEKLCICRH
ncbi:hypothetical protein RKD56_000537 [Priestia megaterium]